ncbi:putative pseudouridine synthase TruD/Pus7 [Xylona heveae TC161]|uniref:Putative pseudouridine synthase TruD/Pus7 n=1 Tax=Xylona heveae (strain CBS 132557 / TC161) TaxID=1328760 RepID=A0A165HX65_XYLHT|nr:putative pseudouridine synthase TruD/Pus7 [Xylona heveae TC161]KZF24052.1 putative pseudouridine synthase TruD/Pus7 [Xylona heveae TC161]
MEESPRKRQRLASPSEAELSQSSITPNEQPAPVAVEASLARPKAGSDEEPRLESDVGITEFISPDVSGFSGILKTRYTDFLVNEILPSGQVLHLESVKVPQLEQGPIEKAEIGQTASDPTNGNGGETTTANSANEDKSQDEKATEEFKVTPEDHASLVSIFGPEVVASIIELHEKILQTPNAKPKSFDKITSETITDRDLRTQMHQLMRRVFCSRLETSTGSDGLVTISASPPQGKGRTRGGQSKGRARPRGKLGWQELGGEYLHFTLYKENKDTMEVISYLARMLKNKPKDFQFAGTKDRRAVTVQRVSVYRVFADRLANLNKTLRGAVIGGFDYRQSGLELGELDGNEFAITLRDCRFPGEESLSAPEKIELGSRTVSAALAKLREDGFINYYGLQRFGTFSTRTDTIGTLMLKGDLKGAIDALLEYSPEALAAAKDPLSSLNGSTLISSDDKARAQAIDSFRTTGASSPALDMLPRKFSAEGSLIRHLGHPERGTDYQGALQAIPRNLRLMYVHAYQSYIWNTIAGERWKRWGKKVVEGDLVLVHEHKDKEIKEDVPEVDEDGEPIVLPAVEDSAAGNYIRARALTAEEAASGAYTIFDIVLPLPGYDILYPANPLGAFYKELMGSEQGGGLDPHDMRRKWKDISLSGSYRKVVARVGAQYSHEVKGYVQDDEQLVQTDLEILKGKPRGSTPERSSEASLKIAAVLKFQLGSSQYATMALRELMKDGGLKAYKPDFGGGR